MIRGRRHRRRLAHGQLTRDRRPRHAPQRPGLPVRVITQHIRDDLRRTHQRPILDPLGHADHARSGGDMVLDPLPGLTNELHRDRTHDHIRIRQPLRVPQRDPHRIRQAEPRKPVTLSRLGQGSALVLVMTPHRDLGSGGFTCPLRVRSRQGRGTHQTHLPDPQDRHPGGTAVIAAR